MDWSILLDCFITLNNDLSFSLEDNKDKIIIQGNKNLRQVSLLIDDEQKLINYFKNKDIKLTVLAKTTTNFTNNEYIYITSLCLS